jgi:hypothetical protein
MVLYGALLDLDFALTPGLVISGARMAIEVAYMAVEMAA